MSIVLKMFPDTHWYGHMTKYLPAFMVPINLMGPWIICATFDSYDKLFKHVSKVHCAI